jgi:hypothetical protein
MPAPRAATPGSPKRVFKEPKAWFSDTRPGIPMARPALSRSPSGRGQGEGNGFTLTPAPLPRWGEGKLPVPSASAVGVTGAFQTRPKSSLTLLLVTIFVAGMEIPAHADLKVSVLLLRPVPTTPAMEESIVRIRSELAAGDFDVTVSDCPAADFSQGSRLLLERSEKAGTPSAALAVFGDLEAGTAELWVADRISGKAVVRRLEVRTSEDRPISEVLAIRAQELLRARLVEVLTEDEERPSPPVGIAPQVSRSAEHADASARPWRFGAEIGLSSLGGWGGIGPALAPAARVRLAIGNRLWARLTALGLGTRPEVTSRIGSARVGQDLLLLECVASPLPGRRLRPVLSLGLGAERFAVDGAAKLPSYQGESNVRWFFAGDVGLGLSLRLGAHWELQLEAHALVALPRPEVRFFDQDRAKASQPTLLAILTLAGGA